jgi:hypothetical protein
MTLEIQFLDKDMQTNYALLNRLMDRNTHTQIPLVSLDVYD